MQRKTIIIIALTSLAALTIGWFIGFSIGLNQGKQANINSYEECVAAGYPVQESYPERCAVPGGNSYTNPVAAPLVETEGQLICLEHKNSDQPHTLECAIGFKAENGEIYTLKEAGSELSGLAGSDKRVRIQGKLENKESETYQSTGELTVDSYVILR